MAFIIWMSTYWIPRNIFKASPFASSKGNHQYVSTMVLDQSLSVTSESVNAHLV